MILFYNAGIYLYLLIIILISPFNKKAKLWLSGRKNWRQILADKLSGNKAPIAWFHCASLGEFEQARPVLENFKVRFPYYKILLTFFSPSGFEIRKNYAQADYIIYLPIDTQSNAQDFIHLTKPKIVYFVKYEFWHHYINELHKAQIPVISFSTIFRKDQLFFKPYGKFYLSILSRLSKIFVQNEESLKLLSSHDIKTGELAGDTRFDRVLEIRKFIKQLPVIEAFKGDSKVFIAGSTWPRDLEILTPLINKKISGLKFIIAPHEIHESEIENFIRNCRLKSARYTKTDEVSVREADILIIDCIGILSSIYAYGTFAYIGGAFGKGLHNTLEAATFGLPLFFGPNYQKFQEAKDLVRIGGAYSIQSSEEFEKNFDKILKDEDTRLMIVSTNRNYIESNKGATDKILAFSQSILKV